MPLPNLPAMCRARNSHRVQIHIRTLATPTFDYTRSVQMARAIYANAGIDFRIMSELCPAISNPTFDLSTINGTCEWGQFNAEQAELHRLGAPGASGVTVFIVGDIVEPATATAAERHLNGCAGHSPQKPTAIVSATGTIYTMAHEVGHVLLGSDFTPVHSTDTRNIMIGGTWQIPAGAIAYFTEAQRSKMLLSPFVMPI